MSTNYLVVLYFFVIANLNLNQGEPRGGGGGGGAAIRGSAARDRVWFLASLPSRFLVDLCMASKPSLPLKIVPKLDACVQGATDSEDAL